MKKVCIKCGRDMDENEFLCPHCGAIAENDAPQSSQAEKSARGKWAWPRLAWVAVVLLLAAAAGLAGWLLRDPHTPNAETTPPATTTVATPTTAPVPTTVPTVEYTVTVAVDTGYRLEGAEVHVYLDGALICTEVLGRSGKITFLLPQQEGYSVRLTGLPVWLQVHYTDTVFSFPNGAQTLKVLLEEQLIPYTVKVVSAAGEPVPGVEIAYANPIGLVEVLVTGDDGCCTYFTDNHMSKITAGILYVPNGYFIENADIAFHSETLTAQVVLRTFVEAGYQPDQIYTVRVVNLNGEPLSDITLMTSGTTLDSVYMGVTNQEGCFCFPAKADDKYGAVVMTGASVGAIFYFEEGSRELVIELDEEAKGPAVWDREVKFQLTVLDEHGNPIPEVNIIISEDDKRVRSDVTNQQGICLMYLRSTKTYELTVAWLPEAYVHLVFEATTFLGSQESLILKPLQVTTEDGG